MIHIFSTEIRDGKNDDYIRILMGKTKIQTGRVRQSQVHQKQGFGEYFAKKYFFSDHEIINLYSGSMHHRKHRNLMVWREIGKMFFFGNFQNKTKMYIFPN